MQLDSRSTLTIIPLIKMIRMSSTKLLDCLFQQWNLCTSENDRHLRIQETQNSCSNLISTVGGGG